MYSRGEMEFNLNRVIAIIEYSDDKKLVSKKTFGEVLNMNSRDMVHGYVTRMKVINQAQRNHARFIASIMLTVLLKRQGGFVSTKPMMVSWSEQKNKQIWKKLSVKRGEESIERLDWFIHKMMIHGKSIQEWLRWPAEWTLIEIEYDRENSDTDYDVGERLGRVGDSKCVNVNGDGETNEENINILKTLWQKFLCR